MSRTIDPSIVLAGEEMAMDIAIHNMWNIVYAFTLLISVCILVFLCVGMLMQWHSFTHLQKIRKDLNRFKEINKQLIKDPL